MIDREIISAAATCARLAVMIVDLLLQSARIGSCTRGLFDPASLAALRVGGTHPGGLAVLTSGLALAAAIVTWGELRKRLQHAALAAAFVASSPDRPAVLFRSPPQLLAEGRVPSVTGMAELAP
jgi:hypothetical protein